MCESRSDFFKNWTKSFNLTQDHIGNRKLFISPCSPLAQSKYFEHNCIFVNDISYQKLMFGQVWGRLSKSPKTDKWAQFYYLLCTKAMEIYVGCPESFETVTISQ